MIISKSKKDTVLGIRDGYRKENLNPTRYPDWILNNMNMDEDFTSFVKSLIESDIRKKVGKYIPLESLSVEIKCNVGEYDPDRKAVYLRIGEVTFGFFVEDWWKNYDWNQKEVDRDIDYLSDLILKETETLTDESMLVRKENKIIRKESLRDPASKDTVRELQLFAQDHFDTQMKNIVMSLGKKSRRGVDLDIEKLKNSSMMDSLVRSIIRSYEHDFYPRGEKMDISTATRNLLKQKLAEDILELVES